MLLSLMKLKIVFFFACLCFFLGKIKIIKLFNESGLFDIVYYKLVTIKEKILEEMKFELILNKLPIHRFDINDIDRF